MKRIILAASGFALVANSVPALAQDEKRREIVTYHDLDLAREEGVAVLQKRVKSAVRRVCLIHGIELWERVQQGACIKRATRDAGEQVARAVLKAREKAGRGSTRPAGAVG